jgi:hydroxymethylglutaryl-CoA lyase
MRTNNLPSHVTIREVGPREGFQILKRTVPTESKLKLITGLVDAGLREIEVASFVRPDKVPTMADADAVIAGLPQRTDVAFTALYLNQKGFLRGEESASLRNKGWLYTSPSQSFLKANANMTVEESLASVPAWIELFDSYGKKLEGLMVSTAFGCGYEGRIDAAAVESLARRFVESAQQHGSQIQEVCLADTIGIADPAAVRRLVRLVQGLGVSVSLHLHNTWGLALTNVYAGLLEGVKVFESSVGGMGGCPFTPGAAGNVATEDVVFLCHSMGVATGVDLEKLCKAVGLAESLAGEALTSEVYQAWKHSGGKLPFPVEKAGSRD